MSLSKSEEMKKLMTLLMIMSSTILGSCEQKLNPSSEVINAFEKKVANAEDVEWEYDSEDKLWEVVYRVEQTEFSATFDENGKWLETEKTIGFSELPAELREVLEALYSDYNIEELEWVDTPEGTFYEVDFELDDSMDEKELELLFSPEGKIIQ
jgi:hypothetical protein